MLWPYIYSEELGQSSWLSQVRLIRVWLPKYAFYMCIMSRRKQVLNWSEASLELAKKSHSVVQEEMHYPAEPKTLGKNPIRMQREMLPDPSDVFGSKEGELGASQLRPPSANELKLADWLNSGPLGSVNMSILQNTLTRNN